MTPDDTVIAEIIGEITQHAVVTQTPVGGGDINQAWRVSLDDGSDVFVKGSFEATAERMAAEAHDLVWLGEPGALAVPTVLGHGAQGGLAYLVLEWIDSTAPRADHDEVLGRGLAELHATGAPSFGASRPGGFGSLSLDNTPCDTWAEFFVTRRLGPLVDRATASGVLDSEATALAARVAERLLGGDLAGEAEPPARLHGDLWAGNAMTDRDGLPVLIDPAAFGGHREVDLAMMTLFGGFSSRVFDTYDEQYPLADGWRERLALWQVAPLCVHALLFGGSYAAATTDHLRRFA